MVISSQPNSIQPVTDINLTFLGENLGGDGHFTAPGELEIRNHEPVANGYLSSVASGSLVRYVRAI